MTPIVVLQTATVVHGALQRNFSDAGLVEGTDYILTDDPDEADEAISAGDSRQLLVTGTFNGNEGAAIRFVSAAKKRQPNLKTIGFSVFPMNGLDQFIEKTEPGSFARLAELMQRFLNR
jgi:hypothetical protein